ncbi:ribosomal protein L33, partial (plastid) [Oldenlandia corymbosa var. corymbosa]
RRFWNVTVGFEKVLKYYRISRISAVISR